MIQTRGALVTTAFIAVVVVTMSTIGTMSNPVMAAAGSGSNGLNIADANVHANTPGGPLGQQDVNFHVGTCNGGHSTAVLDSLGGCAGFMGTGVPSPSQLGSGHAGPHAP